MRLTRALRNTHSLSWQVFTGIYCVVGTLPGAEGTWMSGGYKLNGYNAAAVPRGKVFAY